MLTYLVFVNSAGASPSPHSDSEFSTQLQLYQPSIISLFRQRMFQQWLWQRVRSSIDTFRAASEEEATAHDLLGYGGVGAGTSIQAAAIFDEWRWGGPGTETRNHSQKFEGKDLLLLQNGFRENLSTQYQQRMDEIFVFDFQAKFFNLVEVIIPNSFLK